MIHRKPEIMEESRTTCQCHTFTSVYLLPPGGMLMGGAKPRGGETTSKRDLGGITGEARARGGGRLLPLQSLPRDKLQFA